MIPKDERIVVFASKSGKVLNANSYVPWQKLKDHSFYRSYILTRKREGDSDLELMSFRCLWVSLRAKYVFLTHGPNDILYAHYSSKKTVIYLGHGIPLKNFIFTNPSMTRQQKFMQKLEVPTYSKIIASSSEDAKNLKKCFAVGEEKALITGSPRNDLLLNHDNVGLFNKNPAEKAILYAPTFRDYGDFEFFPFDDLDLTVLNDFLAKNEIRIYLRAHINEKSSLRNLHLSHIEFLGQDKVEEIQFVLNQFDIVVTDYSSIYLDFLLLNRPIIFIPYDLERYEKERGLLYEYERVTPGHKVYSQSHFLDAIEQLLVEGNDLFLKERLRSSDLFHKYKNGFTERVFKATLERY